MEHWSIENVGKKDVRKICEYLRTKMKEVDLPSETRKRVQWYVNNGESVRIAKIDWGFWEHFPGTSLYDIQIHAESEISDKIKDIIKES